MTVQVLGDFARGGLISAPRERASTLALVEKLNIVTADLDQSIGGLSGGNQQKAVLSRSFLYDAKALLIDEPTQGVDAKARFDIYRAIRAKADLGNGLRGQFFRCDGIGRDMRSGARVLARANLFASSAAAKSTKRASSPRSSAPKKLPPLPKRRSRRRDPTGFRSPISANWSLAEVTNGGCRCCSSILLLILVVGSYASLRTDVFLKPH